MENQEYLSKVLSVIRDSGKQLSLEDIARRVNPLSSENKPIYSSTVDYPEAIPILEVVMNLVSENLIDKSTEQRGKERVRVYSTLR